MRLISNAKVFLRNGEDILLLQRSPDDLIRPGGWDIPGGSFEQGENGLQAVIRETEEETGIILDPAGLNRVYCHTEVDRSAGKVLMREVYAGFVACRDVRLSDEHVGAVWIPRDAVLEQEGMGGVQRVAYDLLHESDLWPVRVAQ